MELTFPTEPMIGLAVLGVLVAVAVTLSRTIGRHGVPVVLLFMVLGMVAGSEGIGGVAFEDYGLTSRLGTVALVFMLFDGGLNTSVAVVRSALAPAGVLVRRVHGGGAPVVVPACVRRVASEERHAIAVRGRCGTVLRGSLRAR